MPVTKKQHVRRRAYRLHILSDILFKMLHNHLAPVVICMIAAYMVKGCPGDFFPRGIMGNVKANFIVQLVGIAPDFDIYARRKVLINFIQPEIIKNSIAEGLATNK